MQIKPSKTPQLSRRGQSITKTNIESTSNRYELWSHVLLFYFCDYWHCDWHCDHRQYHWNPQQKYNKLQYLAARQYLCGTNQGYVSYCHANVHAQ